MSVLQVTLIGLGAIGSGIFQQLRGHKSIRITHVVVSAARLDEVQQQLGSEAMAVSEVPAQTQLVLECAGHSALMQHVLPALERGVECAVLSVGALSEPGLPEKMDHAARLGQTQLHVLSGAIGAIDALAAARLGGLDSVTYTGRKPPAGWKNSHAESVTDLDHLTQPTVLLNATAREAARLYPKNANVAATVSLAGLGLDQTQVTLVADPGIRENIHDIHAKGSFGEFRMTLVGKPLANNPKTSALTVLSALRFLHNRSAFMTI
jgi:aspartate dehydrogenase